MRPPLDVDLLRSERCVAIVRAATTEHFAVTARTLATSGIRVLEFPLTTPGVLTALRPIAEELGEDAHVGVGTVTTADEARAARDAGAAFFVTPNLDTDVVAYARSVDLPVLAGAFSPTEVLAAWRAGATAVKLFPASVGGPAYVKELVRGPFPDIPLVPTGGVSFADIPAFLEAGAVAFGMGGGLLGSAPDGGSQEELRSRIGQFRAAAGR